MLSVKLEDVLSYIELNSTKEQKQNYTVLDSEFLSILAYWVKFDQKDQGWQDKILSKAGSFSFLLTASKEELKESLDLADKDIATIKLIYEAALRLLEAKIYNCDIIQHKQFLVDYLIALVARETIEHFIIYFLDEKHQIINTEHQSKGTINTTSIYVREVAKHAFKYQAFSLILVHNHPSGIASPSEADKELTKIMVKALNSVKIKISDHLIIGNGNYFSFAENGLLNPQNLKKIRPI